MNELRSVTVYCGSNPGADPAFADRTRALARLLASSDVRVVFGGGHVGLMGIVADAALAAGGRAVGVIPAALAERELAHGGRPSCTSCARCTSARRSWPSSRTRSSRCPAGSGRSTSCSRSHVGPARLPRKPVGLLDVDGYYERARRVPGQGCRAAAAAPPAAGSVDLRCRSRSAAQAACRRRAAAAGEMAERSGDVARRRALSRRSGRSPGIARGRGGRGRPAPAQREEERGRVVAVAGLVDPAQGVHAVDQHVAAVRKSRERQALAIEVCRVVVAVAGGDPLPDAEQLVLLEAAAARVHRPRRAGGQPATAGAVAVAEAEPGLAVPDERDRAAGPTELISLEAQQVPVAVVGRDDVSQPVDAPHTTSGSSANAGPSAIVLSSMSSATRARRSLMERGLPPHVVANQLGHTDGGALVQRLYGHPAEHGMRDQIHAAFSEWAQMGRNAQTMRLQNAAFRTGSDPPSPLFQAAAKDREVAASAAASSRTEVASYDRARFRHVITATIQRVRADADGFGP